MPKKSEKGYGSGNISDKVKHHNLETLLELDPPNTYFELHSGDGIDNGYEGSSLRVLKAMYQDPDFFDYMTEYKKSSMHKLIYHTRMFERKRIVRKDWRKHIEEYLAEIKKKVNARVNKFSRLDVVRSHNTPFQKTATQKIKRFLYQ